MTSSTRSIRFAGALVALIAGVLGVAGCASDCGANCPVVSFQVAASSGESLSVSTATWTGDACATDQAPECGNFDGSLPCVLFSIIGVRSGSCRLDLTFTNGRAPFRHHRQLRARDPSGLLPGIPGHRRGHRDRPAAAPAGGRQDAGPDGDGDAGTGDAASD